MNQTIEIPILSTAVYGWQLAEEAYSDEHEKYRTKQQWRSFFSALFYSRFAYKWFKMLKSPEYELVSNHRKRLYFKPFRVYMSTQWDKKQKIKVILDTYRYIMNKSETFTNVITQDGDFEVARLQLSESIDGIVTLGYDYRYRKEGELVFSFRCDALGGVITSAAFSFEESEPDNWVCRIGCVQGHRLNDENSSKVAQKLLHGLRPKALIVITIQEFARQLGFTAVYGSGDSIQAYRQKHFIHLPWKHSIPFDYNALWEESGGQPNKDGWYKLPLIPERKTYEEIKTHKRAYYKKRYHMLDELSSRISETVNKMS